MIVELENFHEELTARPMLVAVSKIDLPEVREGLGAIREELEKRGFEMLAFSSATREGIDELLLRLEATLMEAGSGDREPGAS